MRGDKWESHVLREMRNHLTLSKDSSWCCSYQCKRGSKHSSLLYKFWCNPLIFQLNLYNQNC
jgi:hypothetical protein